MSFWTGLEAFTGHRPGAFTGMTMKDLFDNDMWKRLPKTWSGKMGTEAYLKANPTEQMFSRGGEPLTTNWYKGMGAGGQEEVISRHRPDVPQQAFSSPMQPEGALPGPPQYPQTRAYVPTPQSEAIPVPGWTPPRNPAETIQEIGPYWGTGDPYSGWGGYPGFNKNAHMGMGASGYKVPQYTSGPRSNVHPDPTHAMEQMLDMTTVKKITDDASPNTITQTVKQKVPANPTNTLMNMGRKFVGGWQDLARRRHEEEMLRRQRGY